MKQFEKWRKKFDKDHRGDRRYEPSDKQGWKAALEWTQKLIIEKLKLVSYDDNVACVKRIETAIKKELENNNLLKGKTCQN